MLPDLHYRVRRLLRHPASTLTAISVLALGIGVNAGVSPSSAIRATD